MRSGIIFSAAIVVCGAAAAIVPNDFPTRVFQGSFRESCKTTMLDDAPEAFDSVAALKTKYLVADKTMLSTHPEVKGADQDRIDEEKHVVTVTAYLLSCKSERAHTVTRRKRDGSTTQKILGDNDVHIIIGDSAADPKTMLNIEVSGLPRSGDPGQRFERVRNQLLDVLAAARVKPAMSYRAPADPLRVEVTGSLYFDATHGPGDAGDKKRGFVPKTVWEIHPVQEIKVAP